MAISCNELGIGIAVDGVPYMRGCGAVHMLDVKFSRLNISFSKVSEADSNRECFRQAQNHF